MSSNNKATYSYKIITVCSKCVLQQGGKETQISKLRRPTVNTSASPFRRSTRWNERASRGMETDARESCTPYASRLMSARCREEREKNTCASWRLICATTPCGSVKWFLRMHLQSYCIIVTVSATL
ncbi:uncharacterized [Tachysurus ichikawai]